MPGLQEQIADIEAKAADSELISILTTDPERKIYNVSLAKQLRAHAARLRAKAYAPHQPHDGENCCRSDG